MNTDTNPDTNPVDEIIIDPTKEEIPVPAPSPVPMPTAPKRNQHLKKDEPKNRQFTGRATESEEARIKRAIEVRKQRNPECTDIVRLCLALLDHVEADIFQTFKTK